MTMTGHPFVSIVVPVLDEERHVGEVLRSLLAQVQEYHAEILVMDGGSRDATREIVSAIARHDPIVRLIDNPGRTQSAACNLAAELVSPRCRVLLRADAHAAYPQDFVMLVIQALQTSGATSVVVPMHTVGSGVWQRAIAAAQNSRLGNGGSSHRRVGASRFVDHGHHAAFDLSFFRRVGGYDPSFTHNEDAELDVRAHRAGGRVWLCSEASIAYFPRDSLFRLASQYVRHGRGRARTIWKHRLRPRVRQLLPLVLLATVGIALLGPIIPWLGLPAAFYVGASVLWGVGASVRQRDPALLLLGVAAVVMHLAWAIGFLDGCRRFISLRVAPASTHLADTQQARAR